MDSTTSRLEVLEGGKRRQVSDKSVIGSREWAESIRVETKELVRNYERSYVQLSRNLWLLFDIPVDGNRQNNPWWKKWGYGQVGDFEENELGLHRKRAERLRTIGRVLEVELKELDPRTMRRFTDLGYSKVKEFTRVIMGGIVTKDNLCDWIKLAEDSSFLVLRELIYKAIMEHGRENLPPGVLGEVEPVDADGDVVESIPSGGSSAPKVLPKVTVKDEANKPEPEEELSHMGFALYPDQLDTVKAALERAQQLSGSKKSSHNLSLICLDFLATNDFKKASSEQTQRFFIRLEKALGVKVVVVDPYKDNEILYGYKLLDKIVNT